jgi:hypothetical protein
MMKSIMLDIAWWSLTAILLSYIVLVTLLAAVFVWYTPIYTKMLNALDGLDNWRRNLSIFKQHFGVKL